MEPAGWWQEWYRERLAPILRLYEDRGPPASWEQYGEDDLAADYDFDFDEGEY